ETAKSISDRADNNTRPLMPVHIAITRRVRPGYEAEFQAALREFFQTSFAHGGVLGATIIVPPPASDSRDFGILRTFANENVRGDSALAIYSQQRCFQWLHGSPPDLGGHAAGHPRAAGLAALQ